MTVVPPIPITCADRPTVGGLVVPYVNVRLADGGVDFRTPRQAVYSRCWQSDLCQTCSRSLRNERRVLFGGPNQLRRRRFDEPPLCLPCAVYASQACPMVAGRQPAYTDRPRLAEGHRGRACPDPDTCGSCAGLVDADPAAGDASGDPAHPWYALYLRPGSWQVTAHETQVACTDRAGCVHTRVIVNGCHLTDDPYRVVLVSTPGVGRVWQTLTSDQVAAVLPPVGQEVPA